MYLILIQTWHTMLSCINSFCYLDVQSLSGSQRIHWSDTRIPCDGTPFLVLGREDRECRHGPKRPTKRKVRYYIYVQKQFFFGETTASILVIVLF
jgi:hypothetical protein